jgi:hypothetical protein
MKFLTPHFEIMTSRLFHHNRPAIIPGMAKTAGAKALASRLWEHLYRAWTKGADIDALSSIALWYSERYPKHTYSCIIPVLTHFQLILGVDCDSDECYVESLIQLEHKV